jgi:hypothetical protein
MYQLIWNVGVGIDGGLISYRTTNGVDGSDKWLQ